MNQEITIESIEELKERWEMLKFNEGIESLKITECIPKIKSVSFVVRGLSMELEDEFAICSDYDDYLMNNRSAMMMFLRNNLIDIKLIPIKNGYRECLKFIGDEIVYIEKVS